MESIYNKSFFLLLVSFLFLSQPAQEARLEEKQSAAIPENILRTLRQEHPRLLANSKDFALLRSRLQTDPTLRSWHQKLKKKGDELLNKPVCRYDLSEKNHLLDVSREVVKRTYTLSILFHLNNDQRYSTRAWQELEAAAAFPDWNPEHFLDVGEMTHAFAIGYDWLYPVLTKEQRAVLQNAIITKGLDEALMAYQGKATYKRTSWVNARHNWNQVCNGGIGMGALAIADKEPDLAEAILKKVLAVLPNAMQQFGPDGGWHEGPGYWAYATRYNVIFLASLETALGSDFGLGSIDGFSRTALFPLYMNGPTSRSFNYSDATDELVNGYQLLWLAKRFNLPAAATYQKETVKSPHALDLVWYSPEPAKEKDLPLAAYFRSAEVVTMRSAWNDKNAWFVGFKAGDNKSNHSHLDLGGFVLDAMGERWAVDLGKENYRLPEYFDSGRKAGKKTGIRWTYYRTRAEGHNTLVLNPGLNPDQNPLAQTKMEKFMTYRNTSFAIADLSPAYADDAQTVRRGIALANGQSVIIQDEIKTNKSASLYWFMHTPAQIIIQENGRNAMLTIGNKQLEAVIHSPAYARFTVLPAAPLPSSPKPEGINKNKDVRKLTIRLNQVKETRLVVEFRPAKTKMSANQTFYKPLNSWKLE